MTDDDLIKRAEEAMGLAHEGHVDALRNGGQADMDGIFVSVSRQACEEGADFIAALLSIVPELVARVKELEAEVDGAHAIIAAERAEMLALRRRVKELEAENRELAMQALAASGQAQEAYEAQLKAEAALAAAPDVAQAVAEERERCAAKVENMRAHLNYEALLLHMRNTPLPAPLVEQVSIFLDGIAAAIREGKDATTQP